MYTHSTGKEAASVIKETEPENLASKLRGKWIFGVLPSAREGQLPLGNHT